MAVTIKIWSGILQHHSTGNRTFIWGGKAFNPNDEWVLIYDANSIAKPDIINATSLFNLGGMNPWTEVAVALVVIDWPINGTVTHGWSWPNGVFHPTSEYINIPSNTWTWFWKGTGLRHAELESVGYYNFFVNLPDWTTVSKQFEVTGMAPWQLDRYPSGHLWVEGDTLAYTDGCSEKWPPWYGYKHRIPNDWWDGWYVWTDKAGHIWIDQYDHGRIHFIDANWHYRRTILADYQWTTYDNWSMPQTPWSDKAWYIYAQDRDGFHWTYLMFVWYDGKLYRISHTTNLQ